MKQLAVFALAGLLAAAPLSAQAEAVPQTPPVPEDVSEGLSLMEEGARLVLRALIGELEPALQDLVARLSAANAYDPPEIQPNGDILIRRRAPLDPEAPAPEDLPGPKPQTTPEGEEIDL